MLVFKKINKIAPLFAYSFLKNEHTFSVLQKNLLLVLTFFKNHINFQYNVLSTISAVDFMSSKYRFSIVYDLLSVIFVSRLRFKVCINEIMSVPSIMTIFNCANWWEREIWDLYGIYFKNHFDLRRLLTDYGFEGYPMRKDFPLMGFIELRYDSNKKRILMEQVVLAQDLRVFTFESTWN